MIVESGSTRVQRQNCRSMRRLDRKCRAFGCLLQPRQRQQSGAALGAPQPQRASSWSSHHRSQATSLRRNRPPSDVRRRRAAATAGPVRAIAWRVGSATCGKSNRQVRHSKSWNARARSTRCHRSRFLTGTISPIVLPLPVVGAPLRQTIRQPAIDVPAGSDERHARRLRECFEPAHHGQQLQPFAPGIGLGVGGFELLSAIDRLQDKSPLTLRTLPARLGKQQVMRCGYFHRGGFRIFYEVPTIGRESRRHVRRKRAWVARSLACRRRRFAASKVSAGRSTIRTSQPQSFGQSLTRANLPIDTSFALSPVSPTGKATGCRRRLADETSWTVASDCKTSTKSWPSAVSKPCLAMPVLRLRDSNRTAQGDDARPGGCQLANQPVPIRRANRASGGPVRGASARR